MLQQTRVDTVIPYYKRFLKKFPTVQKLAAADQQDVLKLWEGLGYYSRARNLHKAAAIVVNEHAGKVPGTFEALQTLPGLGPYASAAIASIAFDESVPVVDGNVLRVCSRLWDDNSDIGATGTRKKYFEQLQKDMGRFNPSDFNQAMMELGALICTPTQPDCKACPLSASCIALKNGTVVIRPVKKKKTAIPHLEIAVGVINRNGKLLIGKRKQNGMLGGLWEFPGGKIEPGETPEQAVAREIMEETGLTVEVGDHLIDVKHTYSHFKITLRAYDCKVIKGRTKAHSADILKWVLPEELENYPFPTASKKVFKTIR